VSKLVDATKAPPTAANPRLGGHTIAKHVGKSGTDLMARLRAEPDLRLVSSFTNIAEAEWAISKVMQINAFRIEAWANSGTAMRVVLNENVGRSVGYGVSPTKGYIDKLSYVQVVLVRRSYNGMPFYIPTSYLAR
jgi:hypothetical protein